MPTEVEQKQNELVNRPNVTLTEEDEAFSTNTAYPDANVKRVRIGDGLTNVQLPNNFAYNGGDEVDLTLVQFNQISPAAFAAGIVTDITA